MKAIIHIGLKTGVLDPQGRAIARALNDLGFEGVKDARQGKVIELDLTHEDKSQAEEDVKAMCEKLLANMVIESYRIDIED
ncbi:MAG: phosphoribosylformylglycinamidine synthase subunit PurS [Maricaulaceae bacterium]